MIIALLARSARASQARGANLWGCPHCSDVTGGLLRLLRYIYLPRVCSGRLGHDAVVTKGNGHCTALCARRRAAKWQLVLSYLFWNVSTKGSVELSHGA